MRKTTVAFTLLLVMGTGVLAGAVGVKFCLFPFCRNYFAPIVRLLDNPTSVGSQISTDSSTGMGTTAANDTNSSTDLSTVKKTETSIFSNLYRLRLITLRSADFGYSGGGIKHYGNGILLARKNGTLVFIDLELKHRELLTAIPFDMEKFSAYGRIVDEFKTDFSNNFYGFQQFGVRDVLIVQENGKELVFASHDVLYPEDKCHTLAVSMLEIEPGSLLSQTRFSHWRKIFETRPCLEISEKLETMPEGKPTAAHQAGARIAIANSGEILLTIGDYEFDGFNGFDAVSDTTSSYGKVYAINYHTNEARVYSTGHRNPQGLYVSPTGVIWSTEHGPRGGDELNLLEHGNNYGWPMVILGTDYRGDWPFSDIQGSHEGFSYPHFAWTPSIGISQLTGVEKDYFSLWKDDLLVSSLVGNTLYRVRVKDKRVILTEPIKIGHRIRDITEMTDVRIVMKFDFNAIGILEHKNQ